MWDTNIAVYFLQGHFPQNAEKFIDELLKVAPTTISVVKEIELLCWNTKKKEEQYIISSFIKEATVIELNQKLKLTAAELRKKFKIKLPDAIIAATAIVNELAFITRNTNYFKLITNLQIINT